MRITHAGTDSLTARHIPIFYWAFAALCIAGAVEQAPSHLAGFAEWLEPLFLAGIALTLLLLWGPVVEVNIDRKRKRLTLKRWGLLGLRVRIFPADRITALYMERHTKEGRLTLHRLVLMEGGLDVIALTPMSAAEWGMGRLAEQMYDFVKESRGEPTYARY
jgi:hypothetical protein